MGAASSAPTKDVAMRYSDLFQSGELRKRVRTAYARLRSCDLCPHQCRVDRIGGETGFCRAGLKPKVASASLHRGEEPPISGTRGSGTIFFSWCTLRCCFCQNFPISQLGNGEELSTRGLAERMLKLQRLGAHNINLVTPGHYLPQILAALWLAIPRGFRLPLVWNSNGYETVATLALLEGIVDIYLPDFKYGLDEDALLFSDAPDYPRLAMESIRAMVRQVGDDLAVEKGIATHGIIVRHLVLPGRLENSRVALRQLKNEISTSLPISLMSQYTPTERVKSHPQLGRRILQAEYSQIVDDALDLGFENLFIQDVNDDALTPDFDRTHPFGS